MINNEIINGISGIAAASQAYQAINTDVLDVESFEQATCDFIENICVENHFLVNNSCLFNGGNEENAVVIGSAQIPLAVSDRIGMILRKYIPSIFKENSIDISVKIDYAKPFNLLLNIDRDMTTASNICQQILISLLKYDKDIHFRCIDLANGGNFFSSIHKLIQQFPSTTGGKVYTKQNDFSEVIKILENAASDAMTKLGVLYNSVEEYNKENNVKIPKFLTILCLDSNAYHNEDYNRLRILMENGKRNGMSFIIAAFKNTVSTFSDYVDFEIDCSGASNLIGSSAKLPFQFFTINELNDCEIEEIITSLQSSETIDTLYENHPALHTEYFLLDSSSAIRIPFAIDKYGMPLYFEIGGKAPSHALIAGSTGSGKSVALHTLIMQIIHNYHPDDVEIWAIDYKAVEFARYLDHRSPHFRVIAHDTSTEFSLSLIDLLYEEYEKRQQLFLDAKVKSINEYRRVCGKHTMPRIVAIIDEFQLLTQAVQEYTGETDYRTKLENLLRLTRAMGISFVLCSQTIASGLNGLSEAARDQIGCRICLKHDNENEIRETLVLSGTTASSIVEKARELRSGQCIYKRARWAGEYAPDGKAYEFIQGNVIFINDHIKDDMINTANELLGKSYTPKDVILVRGGGRIGISEKVRHPIVQFMNGGYTPDSECVEWYPAAPTSLADAFCVELENTSAENILLVGENHDLRESIVIHSVCGFLMNPNNKVVVCIIDQAHRDRTRMVNYLRNIMSPRLEINVGVSPCLETIYKLKKIRPTPDQNTIYIWYGLDKLKNELFLLRQGEDEPKEDKPEKHVDMASLSREDMIADFSAFLADINHSTDSANIESRVSGEDLTYEDCVAILKQAFEVGPENNKFHMVIFNNRKTMKKSGLIELSNFEHRLGTQMSGDDSYELFGSSLTASKAGENTVIYYAGNPHVISLRPYLIPDEMWYSMFNHALDEI